MYHLHLFGSLKLTSNDRILLKGSIRPLQLLTVVALRHRERTDEYLCNMLWSKSGRVARQHSLAQAIYTLNCVAPGVVVHEDGVVRVNADLLSTDLDVVRNAIEVRDMEAIASTVRGVLLPDSDRASVAFAHWADAVRAEHTPRVTAYIRQEFRQRFREARWNEISSLFETLDDSLSRDPTILGCAIRSQICSVDTPTLTRDLAEKFSLLNKFDKRRAKSLRQLLTRRIRWDRKAKLDVGPFIGRTDHLAEFSTILRSTAEGSGFLACVSGPIGIGKTRVAKHFARLAAIRGSRVKIAQFAHKQSHTNYARLVRGLCAFEGTAQPRQYRDITLQELVHRLQALEAPSVLVVDDLDWGDQSCIELLCGIVGKLRSVPLGLVITVKDTSIVRRLTAEVPHGVQCRRMQLQCLEQQERATLVAWLRDHYQLTDADAAEVDSISRGNPRYAYVCARRARASGSASSQATLAEELAGQLEHLSPLSKRVMSLVAAVGGRVDLRALERTVATPRNRLAVEIEWLSDWGILRRGTSHALECPDEFIREAVVHQFASADLPQLMEKLETETARYSKVDAARMAERRGRHEVACRHYLTAAREAIRFGAYTDASNLLERAIDFASDARSAARARFWRGELYLAMRKYADAQADYSHVVARTTDLGNALAAVCRARHAQLMTMLDPETANAALDVVGSIPIQKLRAVAPRAAAEVLLANAAIAIISGSPIHASEVSLRLQAELDCTPANQRWLELAAALCKLNLLTQGHASALPLSREYMLRARAAGDPSDLAASLMVGAIVLTSAGDLLAADGLYREVDALVSTHGIVGFSHIHALNHAVAMMEMGDIESALDRLTTLRAYDNSVSVRYYVAFDDLNLATAHYEQGNYDAAQFFANEAIARKDAFPRREFVAAVAVLGLVAGRHGEHRRADDIASEVYSLNQAGGDLSYGVMLTAERLRHSGQRQGAIDQLLDGAAKLDAIYKPASLRLMVTAAEMQADLDPAAAARLARSCAVDASAGGMYSIASRCLAIQSSLSS